MTNNPDLQAVCDSCLKPIADGEGHVWVDQSLAHRVSRRQHGDTIPWPDSDGEENLIAESGLDVAWHTTHTECAPVMPTWAYAIAVERINTWPRYLHWTAHLMAKGWIEATDWERLILTSVEPQRGAASGLRPVRPQDLEFRGIGL